MPLIDVVNFNADASCLSASKWLRALENGSASVMCRLLRGYVEHERKVNLGLTGATVLDLAAFNPEAIQLVNEHPEIFQIVLRPFAHDNALLRQPNGFRRNVQLGLKVLRTHFNNLSSAFLAPEVMITAEQISILASLGIRGIFLHRGRYQLSVRRHIPEHPFVLRGVLGATMPCVPFTDTELENLFLTSIHGITDPELWAARAAALAAQRDCYLWRDGESCLLLPLGVELEGQTFRRERDAGVQRLFLSEADTHLPPQSLVGELKYFPLHSLKAWLDTMKLYWFVSRIQEIERLLPELPDALVPFWCLLINSDILSAAEKEPPVVKVSREILEFSSESPLWDGVIPLPESGEVILSRSERAGEGEDYLAYFDLLREGTRSVAEVLEEWEKSNEPHLRKAHARVTGLYAIDPLH